MHLRVNPCKTKTSQETHRSLQKFLEPERKPKVIYTDNSLEFGKSCEDFSWNHCTSTPHRSETNGIAARAVRRVKEGTSAALLQSGLNESWWADSMSPSSTSFRRSPSSPSRCLPQSSTRGPGPTPCATSAWGPWSHLTTRHPSQVMSPRRT